MRPRTASGNSAKDIGALAESTLRDLVRIWLDKAGAPEPARLEPDSQKVDLIVVLPSLWRASAPIPISIQIKSISKALERVSSPHFKSTCLKYPMAANDWSNLRDAAMAHEQFYVAVAVNSKQLNYTDLLKLPVQDRFEWYIVDFRQQMDKPGRSNCILIPIQNRLNLSTFSLLWSALWTKRFFAPLGAIDLHQAPELYTLVPRIFSSKEVIDRELFSNWNFLTEVLPRFEHRFDRTYFAELNFRLGLGHALGIITHKMYDSASNLNEMFIYCPESLYGTANLWLFSQSYRKFMEVSGQVVSRAHGSTNRRLLPLPGPDTEISPLVKSCLWHVALQYAALGVEVKLIYKPDSDAGDDHSYYGGGIGYFPWISLSDDGASWMIKNSLSAANGQHLDFLHQHAKSEYLSLGGRTLFGVAETLGLDPEDLRTAETCPEHLFPPEGLFLRYPSRIFGNDLTRSFRDIAPSSSMWP